VGDVACLADGFGIQCGEGFHEIVSISIRMLGTSFPAASMVAITTSASMIITRLVLG
jgi:hypothetical protein